VIIDGGGVASLLLYEVTWIEQGTVETTSHSTLVVAPSRDAVCKWFRGNSYQVTRLESKGVVQCI
jgi:hypothetical protein